MAAENCSIKPGDVIAVWGCGPVGQFAIRSAFMLGASRVIAIDRFEERLLMAQAAGAQTINHDDANVLDAIFEYTGGRGPDACIDCVGLEAHGTSPDAIADKIKQTMKLELDRPHVLREAIMACGKGGTISVPGVYTGFIDKMPMGPFFGKGLQMRGGQTHMHNYLAPLMQRIADGDIDPSFIITNPGTLDDIPRFYDEMARHRNGFIKSFIRPAVRMSETEIDIEQSTLIVSY